MAITKLRFAVCVAGTFIATLLLFGGKQQSEADMASWVYQVKPKCEGLFNLTYRIDWAYEAREGGSAQRAVKQSHKVCD
jgi:hypothetical protein